MPIWHAVYPQKAMSMLLPSVQSYCPVIQTKHTYILTSKSTLPFLLRYDSLYGVNTTRVVSIAGYVPSNHSSNKIQWQNDKQADACYCDL